MIYIVHLEETDGDFVVQGFEYVRDVKEYILEKKLGSDEYAMIEGQIVSNFNPKDLKI